jgi:hypothetical protein
MSTFTGRFVWWHQETIIRAFPSQWPTIAGVTMLSVAHEVKAGSNMASIAINLVICGVVFMATNLPICMQTP